MSRPAAPLRRPFPIEKLRRIIAHPVVYKGNGPDSFRLKQKHPCGSCWVQIWFYPRRIHFPFSICERDVHLSGLWTRLTWTARRANFKFEISNLMPLNYFLHFEPLYEAARDIEAVDYVVQQYWENPHAAHLYQVPKTILKEILSYIYLDSTTERNFVYRAPLRRSARLGL